MGPSLTRGVGETPLSSMNRVCLSGSGLDTLGHCMYTDSAYKTDGGRMDLVTWSLKSILSKRGKQVKKNKKQKNGGGAEGRTVRRRN